MLDLQTLRIDEMDKKDVEMIGQLRSLKYLGIDFNSLDVAPLAKGLATNKVSIKDLYIINGLIDNVAIKYISQHLYRSYSLRCCQTLLYVCWVRHRCTHKRIAAE